MNKSGHSAAFTAQIAPINSVSDVDGTKRGARVCARMSYCRDCSEKAALNLLLVEHSCVAGRGSEIVS